MDTIVDEIKRCVCLDVNLEERVDIKESIVTLLQRLLKSLEHVNDRLVVKRIVPCGSMEEGTRNWKFSKHNREPIIEFDFLAVLNDPTDTKLSLTEHCSGYMAIMYENDKFLPYCFNKPETGLQADRISFSFSNDLLKSVNFMCKCFQFDNKFKFLQKDECCKYVVQGTVSEIGPGCEFCTEHKPSGYMQIATGNDVGSPFYNDCTLVFKWTSKSQSLLVPDPENYSVKRSQDYLYVLVDFLPAFELFKENRSVCKNSSDVQISKLDHECYLVPKMCKQGHRTCWKKSDCQIEVKILKNSSSSHRVAYMVLKFLCDKLFSGFIEDGSVPTTYRIKTVVLHHIQNCETCEVVTCIKKLLHNLASSFSHQSLSHFINGSNLLAANTKEKLPSQNKTWHKNRCLVVAECFYFIQKLAENCSKELSTISRLSLQTLIGLFKCINRTFHLAWSQTEVEPTFLVNQEELLFLFEKTLNKVQSLDQRSATTFIDKLACDYNFSSLIVKQSSPEFHWTAHLKVWEYESVREMYQKHHFECPDPPGMNSTTPDEKILSKAQRFCGFHSWSYEEQEKWKAKLANSKDPDNIVTALKAVDIYYVDEVKIKPGEITEELFK